MKVLIVGSGGREHALAWKISLSPRVKKLYCAPGNAGIASVAERVDIAADDLDGLARFARGERIDLTVVGPEVPLVAGIVDRFGRDGLRVFGPSKRAAELEGSKVFAKNLMRKHGIPTGDYQVFEDLDRAKTYIEDQGAPIVVKADGLAAGKGAVVCKTVEEAVQTATGMLEGGAFGDAGKRIVVEECLVGEEASILAITDGQTIAPLASSQDHKAAYDGDKGPNTGGMGAYSPAPVVTEKVMEQVVKEVLVPTVHAMAKAERPFKGVLYAGIMATAQGPKVLEFNTRMGDPETQPLLMRLDTDLVDLLDAAVEGTLDQQELKWKDRSSVCVVMASGGYPGSYEKGKAIAGLDEAGEVPETVVFHAGTASKGGEIVTSGGRVLGVTSLGETVARAIDRAYEAVGRISWDGCQYRKDIGAKALAREATK
jgi:phosphoribosylamine--glycine ligase